MTYVEFNKLSNIDKLKFNLTAITAYCNGGCIQRLDDYPVNDWRDVCDNYEYRFTIFMFRVKPKTVKKWVNIHLKSDKRLVQSFVYPSKEIADINKYNDRVACVEIEAPVEV